MIVHRLAYLSRIRNVPNGLATRSKIIDYLSKDQWISTTEVPVTSGTVLYHLKNMQREDVVERNPKSLKWRLAEVHQIALTEFLTKAKKKKK